MSSDTIQSPSAATISRQLGSAQDGTCLTCGALPLWQCDRVKHSAGLPPGEAKLPVMGVGLYSEPVLGSRPNSLLVSDEVADLREQLSAAVEEIAWLKQELRDFASQVAAERTPVDRDAVTLSDRPSKRREASTAEIDVESMSRMVFGCDPAKAKNSLWHILCNKLRPIIRDASRRLRV